LYHTLAIHISEQLLQHSHFTPAKKKYILNSNISSYLISFTDDFINAFHYARISPITASLLHLTAAARLLTLIRALRR
jgi:hypothetical protein